METMQSTTEVNQYGSLVSLQGYQVYEYQLVLVLPEALKEKLRKVKLQFAEQFDMPSAKSSAIMLPLVKFKQRQLLEQKLRHSLQQLIMGWQPFPVNLKGFASQPSHSIYIPVTSKNHLQQCTKSLKTIQHFLRPDKDQAAFFPGEHQVIVASRLKPGIYDKAWKQYAAKQFTAQFMAEAALLLKRRPGELHWQIAQRFEFRNLPVGIRQASLFEA
ncbi:2'-5' RNA ligase family protein [Flavihumibacter profundi]|uniref:2'-5' RNA ligase family protein n=1 Tax=Flavihumibacter profundi TaxID=2716883 RepID=UPI001CC4637F|nr:2'-5' RNA ligase family protein [Flavihumibacter profundi]MBZ5857970.1 2'-5' RNA ligase family protein [Flavihumibacter profundi]